MASASKRFDENGVLVERAISTPLTGETEENEDFTQTPYKEPDRSTMADRLAARTKSTRTKAVDSDDAENKSVRSRSTSKK